MAVTALPQVNANVAGGLGVPLSGEDHITGLLCYADEVDYPSGILKKWLTATAYLDGDVVEDSTSQLLYTVQGDYTSGANVAADVSGGDLVIISSASDIRAARIKKVYKSTMEGLGFVDGGNADMYYYMLNAYFAKNPDGYLWVGFYSRALSTVTFAEIADFVAMDSGKIRKLGIYNNGSNAAFALVHLASIQTQVTASHTEKAPLSVLYCPIVYGEVYGSFLDLRSNGNNDGVRVFNSFDAVKNNAEYPALGTYLGLYAIAKISASVGHVEQNNFVNGTDLENTMILDSSGLIKYGDFSTAQLNGIVTKGFNILYKLKNYFGTYLNGQLLAVGSSYDFQRAEQIDTLNKVERDVRTFCLPLLNSELIFNADGTLSADSIAKFDNAAERALDPILAATEISAFDVSIDPTQAVQTTENLNITIEVVLNGVSQTITVNLTAVPSIS